MQTLLTCAVAGMAIRMAVNDDPSVTTPLLVVSTTGAVLFLTLYVVALRGAAIELRRTRAASA
jgi:hypothetical protein